VADDEALFAPDVGQRLIEFRVDIQNAGAAVFHDVRHLFSDQAKVDRDQHAAGPADTEQRRQQASRVVTDDGNALARRDVEQVEVRRHCARP